MTRERAVPRLEGEAFDFFNPAAWNEIHALLEGRFGEGWQERIDFGDIARLRRELELEREDV